MSEALPVLLATIPVFLMMGGGFLLRRLGVFPESADRGTMDLVLNLLFPALVFDKILGEPLLRSAPTVLWAAGLGFSFVAIGTLLSYVLAPLFGMGRGSGRRTFGLCCGIQNYGFIAIPVMIAIFGASAKIGVLFVHSLGVELAIWTFGVMLLRGSAKAPLKLFFNVPLIAILSGLLLNFLHVGEHLPVPIRSTLSQLGACSIPVSLVLIGASLASLFGEWRHQTRPAVGAILLRLMLIPAMMLAAARYLPVPEEVRKIILVQAAMPAAVFPIILARRYGGHPPTAVEVVIATTLPAIVTIPIVIWVGKRVLGIS